MSPWISCLGLVVQGLMMEMKKKILDSSFEFEITTWIQKFRTWKPTFEKFHTLSHLVQVCPSDFDQMHNQEMIKFFPMTRRYEDSDMAF